MLDTARSGNMSPVSLLQQFAQELVPLKPASQALQTALMAARANIGPTAMPIHYTMTELAGGLRNGAGSGPMTLTNIGRSSGDAFKMQLVNSGSRPIALDDDGPLIVEAVPGAPSASTPRAGANTVEVPAEGYCLEPERPVPPAGTVYRPAPPDVQRRFAPFKNALKTIVAKGHDLANAGLLHFDSEKSGYTNATIQYTAWALLGDWDQARFTTELLEKTEASLKALGRKMDKNTEKVIRDAAPNRWTDVRTLMNEVKGGSTLSPG